MQPTFYRRTETGKKQNAYRALNVYNSFHGLEILRLASSSQYIKKRHFKKTSDNSIQGANDVFEVFFLRHRNLTIILFF